MKVFIELRNESRELKFSGTVSRLLQKLKINPETVIVARNSELVTEKERLADSDTVQVLSVISGG